MPAPPSQQQQQQQQQAGGSAATGPSSSSSSASSGARGFGRGPPDPSQFVSPEAHIDFSLAQMTPNQVLEAFAELRGMIMAGGEATRQFLYTNPQLCHALARARQLITPYTVDLARLGDTPIGVLEAHAMQQQQQMLQQMMMAGGHAMPMPPPGMIAPPAGMAPAQPQQLAPDEQALFAAIMAMSQDQINALPPKERTEILNARAHFAAKGLM